MPRNRNRRKRPRPRSGHCMAAVGDYLVVYGGYSDRATRVFVDLWVYDTFKAVWKHYIPPNVESMTTLSSSMLIHGSKVYMFGGTGFPYSLEITNALISFDLSTKIWDVLFKHDIFHTSEIPAPCYGSGMFYYNEGLYVVGGTQGALHSNRIYKFCLRTNTWSKVEQRGEIPVPNYRIQGTFFNNRYYYLGGSELAVESRFHYVHIFDVATNTWTKKETSSRNGIFPEFRCNEGFTFNDNLGYMTGGTSGNQSLGDFWTIDLRSLTWSETKNMIKVPLTFQGMGVVDNSYLWIFGGRNQEGRRVNSLRKFLVAPPSLQSLARIAVLKQSSTLNLPDLLPPSILRLNRLNSE